MNRTRKPAFQVEPVSLTIAVRAYPLAADDADRPSFDRKPRRFPHLFIFDTESRTDAAQDLTFGSYRVIIREQCVEEGLFYGNDLSPQEMRTLKRYVTTHKLDVRRNGIKELRLLNLHQFRKEIFRDVYKARCLFTAFNHPFDISRVANNFTTARSKPYTGGFSLGIWTYTDKRGREYRDPNRPRIDIKQIDSKRALIGLMARIGVDDEDLIPEGSKTGKPEEGYRFRGHFLDLRTLAYALTDRGHSLESACEAFGVEHGKKGVTRHGEVTKRYIDYNRRDVLASSELAAKLLEEYGKHQLSLQVTKVFSPASIGKGYLRDMAIEPILSRQADFPTKYLGYAQSAFYGGRASAHIRKIPVPVVYTDFLSMYPTVNSLMGLWKFVTAQEIKIRPHCRKEVTRLVKRLSLSDLFKRKTWRNLPAFVRVIPEGDVLPSRSKYSKESNDWQVALNYLIAENKKHKDALWFSLPDVIASKLITGKTPRIVDAFRIEPLGTLENLKQINLRGTIPVDPKHQDFFKVVIEQRKLAQSRSDLDPIEKKRLDKALKVLANAASYGIYAEMIREDSEKRVRIGCHGIDPEPFTCTVLHPERTGEYCFPPLAALITGAARLMLALLETCVTEMHGTYAMEDTDSMAIVATKDGGVVPCVGGPFQTRDGREAIKALSWKQVEKIARRLRKLNPYSRVAVPGSVLKIEDDNWDPITKKQRQLYCLAISAKRYALFVKDKNGIPTLLREKRDVGTDRWSEHGLGHLLNPTDPESEDREWIAQVWLNIVRKSLDLPIDAFRFEHLPAVGRISASSPAVMKSLASLNAGKKYGKQIKPFNFLVSCHVKEFGFPFRCNPERFHLIAPYDSDPRRWLKKIWIDEHSGNEYGITTAGPTGDRFTARVKTYGEALRDYEIHPESKCADSRGNACSKETVGLLQRRHVKVGGLKYIGKESNGLEEVEAGLVHLDRNVYNEFVDLRRDEWATKLLPLMRKIPLKLLVQACKRRIKRRISRRALIDMRAGRSRPHRGNQEILAPIIRRLAQTHSVRRNVR